MTVRLLAALGTVLVLATTGCHSSARPSASGGVEVTQTSSRLRQYLKRLPDLRFGTRPPAGVPVIRVDDNVRYQHVVGVGGALTDTSAWLLHDELSPAARTRALDALFGPDGIRLGVVRVPIGASDFTRDGRPYSYDDLPRGASDPTLAHFSVAHDDAYIVPTLRAALRLRPGLTTIASMWSPPAWMKTNERLDDRLGSGRLLTGDGAVLAAYLVRFLEAYRRRGIAVAALAPVNEPGQRTLYPGLNIGERAEGRLIADQLVPALRSAGLRTRVYAHDYKWLFVRQVQRLVSDRRLRAALSGIAWHCYDGDPTAMTVIHGLAPALDQMETECSSGIPAGPAAEAMIASFRNWASAVLLWNLALDPVGGPVQPPNYGCPGCTAVLTINERTHAFAYGFDYYQLGQFSRFVLTGAVRVASTTFVRYTSPTLEHRINWATAGVDDVAFVNPDGSEVLLAHNNALGPRRFAVVWHRRAFAYTLPAAATVTFRWPGAT